MAKKPHQTSHKSRFETLEDRRLLTTFNVTAPFTQEGSSTPIDGFYFNGEDAYGDNATSVTKTTSAYTTPSGYFNNNTGSGPVTASLPFTYSSGPAAVWDYGDYDAGEDNYANTSEQSWAAQVVPSTFDTMGAGGNNQTSFALNATAGNVDPGLAGWDNSHDNSVQYVYGDSGLNGNGQGNPVKDVGTLHGGEYLIDDTPTGTLELSGYLGPSAQRFTAPTTGSYVISATFTEPYFDPFNGSGGGNGDEAWTWDDGLPEWSIIQNTNNSCARRCLARQWRWR